MIEFLSTYYKELIVLVLCLIEVILSIIALMKKIKCESPLLSSVIKSLPNFINIVEKSMPVGHGEVKKNLVLSSVEDLFKDCGLVFDSYSKKIVSEMIESILSTPHKKEDSTNEK